MFSNIFQCKKNTNINYIVILWWKNKQIHLLSEIITKTSNVYFKIQVISAIIGALTRVSTGEIFMELMEPRAVYLYHKSMVV